MSLSSGLEVPPSQRSMQDTHRKGAMRPSLTKVCKELRHRLPHCRRVTGSPHPSFTCTKPAIQISPPAPATSLCSEPRPSKPIWELHRCDKNMHPDRWSIVCMDVHALGCCMGAASPTTSLTSGCHRVLPCGLPVATSASSASPPSHLRMLFRAVLRLLECTAGSTPPKVFPPLGPRLDPPQQALGIRCCCSCCRSPLPLDYPHLQGVSKKTLASTASCASALISGFAPSPPSLSTTHSHKGAWVSPWH